MAPTNALLTRNAALNRLARVHHPHVRRRGVRPEGDGSGPRCPTWTTKVSKSPNGESLGDGGGGGWEPGSASQVPTEPSYLSDFILFESDSEPPAGSDNAPGTEVAEDVVDRATKALGAASTFVQRAQEMRDSEQSAASPSDRPDSVTPVVSTQESKPAKELLHKAVEAKKSGDDSDGDDATRRVLRSALEQQAGGQLGVGGGGIVATPIDSTSAPPWTADFGTSTPAGATLSPMVSPAGEGNPSTVMPIKEMDEPVFLDLESQAVEDLSMAQKTKLPPLQSVLELTTAAEPPSRGVAATMGASKAVAGRMMEDGTGTLADGTEWERTSGEEKGENGYWRRWTRLQGKTQGKVQWEEHWWEVSDWSGMKELGAEKKGSSSTKGAWRETWTEKLYYQAHNLEPVIERSANKWAHAIDGNEWEEKWGEYYEADARTKKHADKWAKDGGKVWHERWGEDYDGHGGCVKWTDKWAEALVEGGKIEWGDKWEEKFAHGKGSKTGETWNIAPDGNKYQRWWGENHFGNGWVQKYGNSTSGESWDQSVQMDTYYNPVPHFGFSHAEKHSPKLVGVPELPRDDNDGELGPGLAGL